MSWGDGRLWEEMAEVSPEQAAVPALRVSSGCAPTLAPGLSTGCVTDSSHGVTDSSHGVTHSNNQRQQPLKAAAFPLVFSSLTWTAVSLQIM